MAVLALLQTEVSNVRDCSGRSESLLSRSTFSPFASSLPPRVSLRLVVPASLASARALWTLVDMLLWSCSLVLLRWMCRCRVLLSPV